MIGGEGKDKGSRDCKKDITYLPPPPIQLGKRANKFKFHFWLNMSDIFSLLAHSHVQQFCWTNFIAAFVQFKLLNFRFPNANTALTLSNTPANAFGFPTLDLRTVSLHPCKSLLSGPHSLVAILSQFNFGPYSKMKISALHKVPQSVTRVK